MSILLASMLVVMVPPSAISAFTTVDAVVVLKPGFTLNELSGVQYKRHFNAINGFSATMSLTTFNWLDSLPYVFISENTVFHILEDTLDWGVDDIDAEEVWGGAENAVDVVPGNVAGEGVVAR